jgi:hypothetical protein
MDLRNAYGRQHRSYALRGLARHNQKLARMQAMEWQAPTPYWLFTPEDGSKAPPAGEDGKG